MQSAIERPDMDLATALLERSRTALRSSERRLEQLLDALPFGVALVDDHGHVDAANRTLARWFGRELEDFVGHSLFELVGEEQSDFIRRPLSHSLRGGTATTTVPIPRKGGGVELSLRLTSIESLNETRPGVLVVANELAFDARVQREWAELRRWFDSVESFGFVASGDGQIVRANGAFARAVGRRPSEITGTLLTDWVDSEDRSSIRRALRTLDSDGTPATLEFRLVAIDGTSYGANWRLHRSIGDDRIDGCGVVSLGAERRVPDFDHTPLFGRVVIADRRADERSRVADMAEELGLEVSSTRDPEIALQSVLSNPVSCDVVILDRVLPETDGEFAVRSLRRYGFGGAIVVVSSQPSENDRDRMTRAGADAVLPRPLSRKALASTLRGALAT